MNIIECIQGSQEWIDARLGRVTGTGFAKVLAKGQGKTRKSYLIQLAAERLSGLPQDSFTSGAMDWGTEHEDEARACYEAVQGVEVKQVGFVELDEYIEVSPDGIVETKCLNGYVGVSPDGLVGEDGGAEIKCPNTSTHIKTILSGKMPPEYTAQVQGGMWVAEREWCDFVSFDPRMKSQRIFIVRVKRDQEYIDNLQYEVEKFVKELKILVETIDSSPF